MSTIYTLKICTNLMNSITANFINNRELYNGNLIECINQQVPMVGRNLFVEALNACDCCEHHKINRPGSYIPWKDTPFNNTYYSSCNCKCRHYSRWICRTCLDNEVDNADTITFHDNNNNEKCKISECEA